MRASIIKALSTHKGFIRNAILAMIVITILTIIAANLIPTSNFGYIILLEIVVNIVLIFIEQGIAKLLDVNPMPPIDIDPDDYDKSIEEINRFLKWLVKERNISDLATLYIRDDMDPQEFNLIGNHGLDDSSPMYGPLVFDDFRQKLDDVDYEKFEEILIPSNENPKGFRARERVRYRAIFKLADKGSKAVLYLNWRNAQTFTRDEKNKISEYAQEIFKAVNKLQGHSEKRRLLNHAELTARRWIDNYKTDNYKTEEQYRDYNNLIIGAVCSFLTDRHVDDFIIRVVNSTKFTVEKSHVWKGYHDRGDDPSNISHYEWVAETTRPKFLEQEQKIILPIRLPPDLKKCSGVILIYCPSHELMSEMVKPLCFLADHFGLIEYERNMYKQASNKQGTYK